MKISDQMGRILGTVIFVLGFACAAWTQTETVIHAFSGPDGSFPNSGLTLDSKGNLYGLAGSGGPLTNCECGVAYQLVPGSNGTYTENVIYPFGALNGTSDGVDPTGPLTFDSKGNLYGTATAGGSTFQGLVFELTPTSSGYWIETILYNFTGGNDGSNPGNGVVFDNAGNLYGFANGGQYGYGVVFELTPNSNGTWTETTLYSFTGNSDGGFPRVLLLDVAGNIYGVAAADGLHDYGAVFELVKGTNGIWTQKILHSFTGGAGGFTPLGLTMDESGKLYGVAEYVAFELTPSSTGWTYKAIHNFTGGSDGVDPDASLIIDNLGNLYSTTFGGGAHRGTVFELKPGTGGTWTEKILHRFASNGVDGVQPTSPVVIDASGTLYGVTTTGGASNDGVVFRIKP